MYTKILLLILVLTWTTAAPRNEGGVDYFVTLNDKYKAEHQTVEELKVLLKCLIDAGPCSEVYTSYRVQYPEVIIEACRKCNVQQKQAIHKFLDRSERHAPVLYRQFQDKYDPDRKYWGRFYDAVKDY